MAHLIVSFNQHQQLNLRQNPISSVSALTPVVNQADSIAIAPVLSENLVKKPRERPWAPERRSNQKLQVYIFCIISSIYSGAPASETPAKKARGRPPCSGKKKQPETSGTIGISSVNRIIHVDIGEDIVSKIMTILDQGPPAICILFGAGSLCEATLWNSAIGTMTHEGQFDIISLTGSFMRSENGITGGLNLSMTRPDGRFFGGVVEGKLRAATPVQVVVRSFFPDMEKPESKPPSSTPTPNVLNFDPPVSKAASPSTPSSTHLM
ncbi:AT-hook motif nuclear-localized protein 13 [Capsicum annuum]|uniref:AT-hook motif nuclear-localized protein 13 n=1 Tax=Capsicum annuum TaxID=4072 RepID=UPI001FB164A5|nr:AT-hook motif nuclear-localized protein 13 [Capsicum annuum]